MKFKLFVLLLSVTYGLAPALALTASEHAQLELGMTFNEVKKILGDSVEEMRYPNLPLNQKMYRWKEGKSWIALTLVNSKVESITSNPDLATAEQRRQILERSKAD